jgi:Protein of unknown function (DUF1697)
VQAVESPREVKAPRAQPSDHAQLCHAPRVPRYAALLRAISNVEMAPLRRRLESLGFTDVESYGTSGNFLFTTERSPRAAFLLL